MNVGHCFPESEVGWLCQSYIFLEYHHFKMEKVKYAVQLIRIHCQVSIVKSDRKLLTFEWNGQTYQYTCLTHGLSPAPRVFTKLM